jgi:hypothetical protein
MTHAFLAYLAIAGGVSAGLQVTRGVVRGAGRLIAGDPLGALAEVAGGLAAPACQVYREGAKLAIDVFNAAQAIVDGSDAQQMPCPMQPTTQAATINGKVR